MAATTLSKLTILPFTIPRLRAVAMPITWILSGAWILPIKTETLYVPISIATTEGTASLITSLPSFLLSLTGKTADYF